MGKQVLVRPIARGQKPGGAWVDEGGEPFLVDEGKVSKRWMKPLRPDEVKEFEARNAPPVSVAELSGKLSRVTEERDKMDKAGRELAAKLSDAELGRSIAMEAANLLQVELGDLLEEVKGLKAKADAPPEPAPEPVTDGNDPLAGVGEPEPPKAEPKAAPKTKAKPKATEA